LKNHIKIFEEKKHGERQLTSEKKKIPRGICRSRGIWQSPGAERVAGKSKRHDAGEGEGVKSCSPKKNSNLSWEGTKGIAYRRKRKATAGAEGKEVVVIPIKNQ